jgi:predicted alpha/beta-hydrolase family hydrolase
LNTSRELTVPLAGGSATTALLYEAVAPSVGATFILAHGAGAGQRSTFMTSCAQALASLGVAIITFDFPYMSGRRRLPDRAPVLEACYRTIIGMAQSMTSDRALFIGGKSMGGRIATQVAAADPTLPIAGLILLGYPLHPPGRPDTRRDAHLPAVGRPMLFVQGERDTFGTPEELAPVLDRLAPPPRLHVVARGDHSFKVSRAAPGEQAAAIDGLQRTIAEWIRSAF